MMIMVMMVVVVVLVVMVIRMDCKTYSGGSKMFNLISSRREQFE